MNVKRMFVPLTVCMLMACALPQARADIYGFECLTNNGLYCPQVASQITVTVTSYASTQVLFTFRNSGPTASSITGVLFDDGSLLGIASLVNQTGVSFAQLDPTATPPLPGRNNLSPPFATTAGFGADATPPTAPSGVNPGESLGIIFNLLPGKSITDTTNALANGSLRIGLHVQAMPDGSSEGLVNSHISVPEPTSIFLLGSALMGITCFWRKRFIA